MESKPMQSSTMLYPLSQSSPVTESGALPLWMGVKSALQSISALQFEQLQKKLFMEHSKGQGMAQTAEFQYPFQIPYGGKSH